MNTATPKRIERLIIAGGRDYEFTPEDASRLDALGEVGEVVHGAASGADAQGEAWAWERSIPVKRFAPNWEQYGRSAGPIRNKQMAEYATAVALFPGGRGTASMRREAEAAGLEVFDFTGEDG